MNLSGESIRSLVDYYKIDEEHELLVIYDDINLGVGQLRIREKGSAGGHNGIKNIMQILAHRYFRGSAWVWGRSRPGTIWRIMCSDMFSKAERELMDEGYDHAVTAAGMILSGRIGDAMSEYNRKKKEEPRT